MQRELPRGEQAILLTLAMTFALGCLDGKQRDGQDGGPADLPSAESILVADLAPNTDTPLDTTPSGDGGPDAAPPPPNALVVDGVGWRHPLPHGNTMTGVVGFSTSDVWAVGYEGLVQHFDGTDWQVVHRADVNLFGVWGASPSSVWMVGEGGAVLHYDGTGYEMLDAGTTRALHDIWGSSPTDVHVVGDDSTWRHFDGTTWTSIDTPESIGNAIRTIWGASSSAVWAETGWPGIFYFYDGAQSTMASGGENITAIGGHSATDVVATVLEWDDAVGVYSLSESAMTQERKWSAVKSFPSAVVPGNNAEMWILGGSSVEAYLLHRDGSGAWSPSVTRFAGSPRFSDGWVDGDGILHLVGTAGTAATYDSRGLHSNLHWMVTINALFRPPGGALWAVGNEGTILRHDDSQQRWEEASIDQRGSERLTTIWGAGPNDIWAAGEAGALYRYDGALWKRQEDVPLLPGDVTADFSAIWGFGATEMLLGASGPSDGHTLFRFDGSSWTPSSELEGKGLETVETIWGTSPTELFVAGGPKQTICHYRQDTWECAARTQGTDEAVLAIHGSSPTNIWAVGAKGRFHFYNGSTWHSSTLPSYVDEDLHGVAVTAEDEAWAVGEAGIFRLQSGVWAHSGVPASRLRAVFSSSATDVWFGGRYGALLHFPD